MQPGGFDCGLCLRKSGVGTPIYTVRGNSVTPTPAPAAASTVRPTREDVEAAVRVLLRWTGDDPDREGLRETPARVTRAYAERVCDLFAQLAARGKLRILVLAVALAGGDLFYGRGGGYGVHGFGENWGRVVWWRGTFGDAALVVLRGRRLKAEVEGTSVSDVAVRAGPTI